MKKVTFLIVLLALFFSWYGTAQITSYPYSEDFEAGAGGWAATNGANGTWALGAPTANVINSAASGANAWATNLSGDYNATENSFVQSPVFDLSALSAPSIQFSLWWNAEFSWDGMVLQSSIDSGASWQNVGAFGDPNNWYTDNTINGAPGGQPAATAQGWSGRASSTNGSNGWRVARHALTGLAGQSNVILRFAFGSDGSIQDNGVAFDLVSVFEVTCPEPSGLIVNSQTATTANISWTPGGSETSWEVATQPAGTGIPSGPGNPTMNNAPYVAMGLNPSSPYEVYVRSSCGSEFSPWIGPINFLTECTTFTAPYSQGFENAGVIPICWSMSGGEVWRFSNTGAGNHIGNNGAITGTTVTNGYFAWVDSSGTDAPATLLSPMVDVSGLTTPALSFYEISNNEGNANSTLTVDVWDGAAWNNVGIFNTNTSGWEQKIIDLSSLTITGDVQVRFVFSETVSGDFYDDIAIDDVRLDEAPACIIPSGLAAANVTGNTADISWNAGTSSAWEYVIQPAGTGPPSGNGTALTVTTVNETGLNYATSYEVYIRTDCGANGYSEWIGPLTFTTTIQTNFTVDCNAGPVNSVSCYAVNDGAGQAITFTSSDGITPLNITFNSGNVENNFDELIVLDSDGTTNLNAATPYGVGGNVAGITYQSTGATISFYVDSDFTISCQSSTTINPLDVTITCATCVNPIATYTVRSDCFNGPQFFVDVDVTSLGSATSLTLTDNQASTPQTITAVGLVSFGPFPNTTNVQITVANDDDSNCVRSSGNLTQAFCLDTFVDCTLGPVNVSYCYVNNESNVFSYVSSDGSPLNLTINSGEIEGAPFDFLVILDSDGVTELYNGEGNNGILAGLTFQSTGDTIYFSITSDGSVSCDSGSFPAGIDYTVSCATCINPAATYSVIDDCANGPQFLIDVNITSLGDAASVTVTDNQASPGMQVSAPGVVQMGPYPFATPIIITISNDQDVNCVINSTPIQVAACPPVNDNCSGAIVAVVNPGGTCDATTPGSVLAATPSGVPAGSCAGNPDDDVWYQFTALNEVQLISLINITGGSTNLDHAVYSGNCGSLTELYCSPNTSSVTPLLTVGTTYYIRVFSGGSVPESSNFDLCIQKAPDNTICEQAANFCSAGGTSTGSNIIGFPSSGSIACLGSNPNPSWNIIQIGQSGLIEIEIVQTSSVTGNGIDVDFVLWGPFDTDTDYCSLGLEVDCPTCPNNTSNPNFYPFGNIVDCSYDPAFTENLTIQNAQAGEIYLLLVTNFSNQPGNISITQTNSGTTGAGSTVASIQVDLGDDQEFCGIDSLELSANSPFADSFEWYADGFVIEGETTSTLTVTETNTYTVIAYDSQCDVTAQDAVTITFGLEPIANAVQDIVTCDDISGDGVEIFNWDFQTAIVLGGQDPALFNVTYHLSQSDAITNTGALASPYANISNPQTIWIRVEDANATYCIATTNFDLVVSGATPTATSVDLEVCDDPSGDGFAPFDLTTNDLNVLNGQNSADFSVTYYATQADADAGINALVSPYTNTTNPQTIWARVDNNTAVDCYAIAAFDLIVSPPPMATSVDMEVCDDPSEDGFESFDLTANDGNILNGQSPSDFTVSYYASQADADAGNNELVSPYTNTTNPQTIWARVDNNAVIDCYGVVAFDLIVSPPLTVNPSPDVPGCDTDDNSIAEYDLTVNESIITGGQVGLTVTYYTAMADANAGTGSIGNPTNYETSLTTIYVRVEDSATGCYNITSFNLVAGVLPMTSFVTDFDYEVCPNATVPIIISVTPQNYTAADVSIVWYQDGGVVSGQNSLTLPVLTEGYYEIGVTFNETGCTDIVGQQVVKLDSCIIPQGISPDGDGKNDTFDLSNFDVKRIEIFNRLGTLVYSKDNYSNEWYGQTNNGDELPVGTYFYTMVYEGGAKQMSAWVYINK